MKSFSFPVYLGIYFKTASVLAITASPSWYPRLPHPSGATGMSSDLSLPWPRRMERCFKLVHRKASEWTFKNSSAWILKSAALRTANLGPRSSPFNSSGTGRLTGHPPHIFKREPLETVSCNSLSLSWTHLRACGESSGCKGSCYIEAVPKSNFAGRQSRVGEGQQPATGCGCGPSLIHGCFGMNMQHVTLHLWEERVLQSHGGVFQG